MKIPSKELKVQLDWQKLLGFDQACRSAEQPASKTSTDPRTVLLGAKIGTKPGIKGN